MYIYIYIYIGIMEIYGILWKLWEYCGDFLIFESLFPGRHARMGLFFAENRLFDFLSPFFRVAMPAGAFFSPKKQLVDF